VLRTTFIVAVSVLATIAVAQICGGCGRNYPGYICATGCDCDWIAGGCSAPAFNTIAVTQCPSWASCNASAYPCSEPLHITAGSSCQAFNGSSRPERFACVDAHRGLGTVVITDCVSGNVTRIPNNVCIPQNGGWNRYVCEHTTSP
jgi:hypothetical protein